MLCRANAWPLVKKSSRSKCPRLHQEVLENLKKALRALAKLDRAATEEASKALGYPLFDDEDCEQRLHREREQAGWGERQAARERAAAGAGGLRGAAGRPGQGQVRVPLAHDEATVGFQGCFLTVLSPGN